MRAISPSFIYMNIAFDIAGVIILFLVMFPMLRRGYRTKRKSLLLSAVILHVFALFLKIGGRANLLFSGAINFPFRHTMMAIVADIFSVINAIWCVLADNDGNVKLKNRITEISPVLVAYLLLPTLIAIGAEIITHEVRLLGISYAVSLHLIYNYLKEQTEKALLEKEKAVNEAQSKLLAEQIQPHFIFNSLMAIESLIQTDPDKAVESIENFAGYLRGNIDALMSDELIPFKQELSHIEEFAALELADPDRQFTMDYDFEIEDFMIPALSIQPIVENAIKHGALSHKDGSGHVLIKTEEQGPFIRILVEDNGTSKGESTAGKKKHEGIGMKNAENRIVNQCGGTFHFEVADNGAKATILIPKH